MFHGIRDYQGRLWQATVTVPIMADKQAVIVETEKLTGDDTKMLESLDIPETTIFIVVVSDLWKHGQMHSNP